METKSSGFWSSNFIGNRRKNRERLLGLHDKGCYASLSSLGEVQVSSETSIKPAGNVWEAMYTSMYLWLELHSGPRLHRMGWSVMLLQEG